MNQREFDLDHIFTYHAPNSDQVYSYQEIRNDAKRLARTILRNTLPSADQSDAIRKLRECVHMANAAIALEGRIYRVEESEG